MSELAEQQARILAAAATLVEPGGRLVYATCSLLPEEDEAIVDACLAAHPEFAQAGRSALLAQAGIALTPARACGFIRTAMAATVSSRPS